jgi:hypothetical protein
MFGTSDVPLCFTLVDSCLMQRLPSSIWLEVSHLLTSVSSSVFSPGFVASCICGYCLSVDILKTGQHLANE